MIYWLFGGQVGLFSKIYFPFFVLKCWSVYSAELDPGLEDDDKYLKEDEENIIVQNKPNLDSQVYYQCFGSGSI